MRQLILLAFLLLPTSAWCQTTVVSGTVTDAQGNAYANGTASAIKVVSTGLSPGTPTTVPTSATGFFTFSGSTNALPSPASYQFTVCATPVLLGQPTVNPTPRQICFTSGPIAISGASQDISTTLNAIAPTLGPQGQGTNPTFINPTVTGTLTVPAPSNCANSVSTGLNTTLGANCTNSTGTGAWTVGGTLSATGGGSLGGTYSGNPTLSGNLTVSGTGTLSGGGAISGGYTVSAISINNVQMCDQFAGATADLKIAACIAALPINGGTADARGLQGNQSFASTLVINKTITLLLGAAKITGPASGDMIDVQAPGVIIRGIGSMQNTGATQGTVLVPVTAAQAHGINFQATGSGNVQYKVEDLTINDSTAGGTGRTAGDGIRVSANASPAQNSIGYIDNVYVSFMFNGINLIRPITTKNLHMTLVSNANDGWRAQGDGTSTWCDQCYSNHSGRHNFSLWGMNYSGVTAGASDTAQKDGYRIDDCQDDGATCGGGNSQSLSITINGGAEVDCQAGAASCAGIHIIDAIGVELYGQKVLNSKGYGIWINGGRGVSAHGFVTGSISNDLQVDCSSAPALGQCASGNLMNDLIYSTSGGGQLSSNFSIIGWTGGGGGASALFNTTTTMRGPLVVSDQGAICTNGELALSANWAATGSATVTGVAGNGQTCSWTITTGTTTAANPTVTDTLTNPLPAATTRCWMFLEYGPASTHTAAAGEGFAQTTLSATAPIFTFNGTPTAANKTYLVVRTCGP